MAVSLLCAGCLREEEVDFSQVRGAIVGGEPASLPEDTVAVALALRFGEETLAFCSGALIAPDVVLTAAHCLDSISTFSFKAIWEAGLVRVVAGESIDAEEASYYEVLRYVVHPAFDMEAARHDLGMLWLDRPVPDAYTYPILEDVASVIQMAKDNHEVRFLGYGLDEEERDGQRLKVSGTVSRICSQKRTLHSEDCIVKLESGAYLTLPYGTFLHSLEEGGPCHGDSGGPVLAQWKGETYLVGLVSGGDGECRVMGITTLLAMRSGWIKRQLYGDDGSDCHAGNLRSSRPVDERTGIVPWLAVILLALGILALLRYKNIIKNEKFARVISILMMSCFVILALICFTGFVLMTAGQIHYGSSWRFNLYGYLVSTLIVAGCLATQIVLLVKDNKKVTRILK